MFINNKDSITITRQIKHKNIKMQTKTAKINDTNHMPDMTHKTPNFDQLLVNITIYWAKH